MSRFDLKYLLFLFATLMVFITVPSVAAQITSVVNVGSQEVTNFFTFVVSGFSTVLYKLT